MGRKVDMDLGHEHYQPKHYGSQAQSLACPICDHPILPSTKFCAHCRAAILRRYCPGCAKLVPDAAYLCPYCDTPSTAQYKQKQSYASFAVGAGILLVFIYVLMSTSVELPKDQSPFGGNPARTTTMPEASKAATPAVAEPYPVAASIPARQPAAKPAPKVAPDPAEGERLNYQGHQLIQQKQFNEAVIVLRKAVALLPDAGAPAYSYARFNLGQALRITGNAKEAIPFLEEALKVIPQKELAQDELTKAHQILDRQ